MILKAPTPGRQGRLLYIFAIFSLLVSSSFGGPAVAEVVLTDPSDPLYYQAAAVAGSELQVEKNTQVTGSLISNGIVLLKKDVVVDGDVAAVGMVQNEGTVTGTVTEGAEPVVLPPIPDETALRALADRVFEDGVTLTDATIDDVVFVAGDVRIEGGLSGVGTILASGEVRLRESGFVPTGGDLMSIITPGPIRFDKNRVFRGVLRSGADLSFEQGVVFEGVAIADGELHVKKDSQVDFLALEPPSTGSPPTLILVSPREAVVFESPTIIATYFDDEPGLDLASLSVTIDDASVLADCVADSGQVVCTPEVAVGSHVLRLAISDLEGTEKAIEHEFERIAEHQPPVLAVVEPEEGVLTNEALVAVRGTVFDDGVVTSVAIGDQELSVDGTTFEGFVTVSDGANTLVVEATDAAGNTASVSRSFVVDLEAPEVVLISPRTDTVTHSAEVRVQGFASDLNGVTGVTLQGDPLTLDDGTFDTLASLTEGANLLPMAFTDGAGNVQQLLLEVEYRPLPEIVITSPANFVGTTASEITVQGTVGPGIVAVTVAGLPATLTGNTFEVEIPLEEGRNAISAVATTADGQVGLASLAVLRDTTPPRVTVESPGEGAEVDGDRLTVRGMVSDPLGFSPPGGLGVTVNGLPAAIAQGGYRVSDLVLVPGANTLTIVATDALGNQSTLSRQVVYTPRVGERLEVVSGDFQQVEVVSATPEPLVVRAVDTAGQPVVGQLVVFTAAGNDGTLAPDLATPGARKIAVATDGQGLARAFFTTGTFAGVSGQRVEAAAVGYGDPVVFQVDTLPAPPDRLVIDAGNGQVGLVGSTLSRELVAVAVDASGNRLGGVTVEFEVAEGGGLLDGGVERRTVTTDDRGRAITGWTLGGEAGISNQVVRVRFADFPGQGFASFVASAEIAGDPADTSVVGAVLDNTDQPVPGATVGLVGTAFSTTTGADGRFELLGVPVGDVLLEVDADTTSRPGHWPHLEFELFLLPGVENRFDRPFYVLPLDDSEGVMVSETEGGTLTLAEVPGFALEIAPGSVTFPDGSRSGTVSVTPVHFDRVPMAPNFGQQPRFVVTIQPSGAIFDPPARLTLPNVSGLAPGRTTEMFSFDHDLARFVDIGHGTVSDDGTVIVSNPGIGVIEAGWHCGSDPEDGSGATHKCPPCRECEGDTCVANPDVNGFPICDDKDRCTINDRCEDGYCRGTFVRIYDIEGPCIAALGQPVTFVARSNGGHLLKWRGGDSPPEGMGGSFTTVFGESFIPPDQFSGSATVTASCALSKSKTINLGRSCGGVTPELIQEVEELPDTPELDGKDKQGNPTKGKPWGLHRTEYDLEVTGCLGGGKWCYQLETLTAMHKIYVQETPGGGRVPLQSPQDPAINSGNCDAVLDDLTPKPQYACPGSGGQPRATYFNYLPIPIVKVHEGKHRSDTIDCIDQPLFNHMKAFIADGKHCKKCAPSSPPQGLFDQELKDQEFLLSANKAYGLNATNIPDLLDLIDQLGDDPNRHDEGKAYEAENDALAQWRAAIRKRARDNGWKDECR